MPAKKPMALVRDIFSCLEITENSKTKVGIWLQINADRLMVVRANPSKNKPWFSTTPNWAPMASKTISLVDGSLCFPITMTASKIKKAPLVRKAAQAPGVKVDTMNLLAR